MHIKSIFSTKIMAKIPCCTLKRGWKYVAEILSTPSLSKIPLSRICLLYINLQPSSSGEGMLQNNEQSIQTGEIKASK